MDRAVAHGNIFTHTSLAGRDDGLFHNSFGIFVISTHTSLAGRDLLLRTLVIFERNFYSHVPDGFFYTDLGISTHTSLAGRDRLWPLL